MKHSKLLLKIEEAVSSFDLSGVCQDLVTWCMDHEDHMSDTEIEKFSAGVRHLMSKFTPRIKCAFRVGDILVAQKDEHWLIENMPNEEGSGNIDILTGDKLTLLASYGVNERAGHFNCDPTTRFYNVRYDNARLTERRLIIVTEKQLQLGQWKIK